MFQQPSFKRATGLDVEGCVNGLVTLPADRGIAPSARGRVLSVSSLGRKLLWLAQV